MDLDLPDIDVANEGIDVEAGFHENVLEAPWEEISEVSSERELAIEEMPARLPVVRLRKKRYAGAASSRSSLTARVLTVS